MRALLSLSLAPLVRKPASYLVRSSSTGVTSSSIPRVTPYELHWACRSGEPPIILDARPAREHDVFRIMGAISIPAESATLEDIDDIPRERPVYVHGSSDADGEAAALSLASKIAALPRAPKVHIVRGGPNEIRQSGFIYINDVEGEQRLAKIKADEAKAAAAATVKK